MMIVLYPRRGARTKKHGMPMWMTGHRHRDPRWRYRAAVDLRDENWVIRESFTGPAPPLASFNMRKEALS